MADLADLSQFWGSDLDLSATGGLALVTAADRSKQRVLRRLLTNPGDYIFHPTYGAGLRQFIGQNVDLAKAKAVVRGQMKREASVSQVQEPTVIISPIENGLQVDISYTVAPEQVPAVLSFSVER
jgi:phage baseplate assembly protein W